MKWSRALVLVLVFFLLAGSAAAAKTAEEWYEAGFQHSLEENDERALRAYLRALRLKPDWAQAHHAIAIVYARMKEGVQAVHHLRKAEKLYQQDPHPQALKNLQIVRNNLKKAYARFDLDPKEFEEMEHLRPATGEDWHSSGEGFLLGDQGYLLTLLHMVEKAGKIRVRFPDGATRAASLVRPLIVYNLAVLKLEGDPRLPIEPLELGDASRIAVGDPVFSVDYQKLKEEGANPVWMRGIITALTAIMNDKNIFEIKGPYDPDRGGGPLLNGRGEVVGILLSRSVTMKNFQAEGRMPKGAVAIKSSYLGKILSGISGFKMPRRSASAGRGAKFPDGMPEVKPNLVIIETSK